MSILVLTSDTLIGTPATGNLEYNGQFFGTDSNASRAQLQRITRATAVASTSGTSIDFTGIPAWVEKITVMFSGVSLSGTSSYLLQLGAGSVTTTGYLAYYSVQENAGTPAVTANTSGFQINANNAGNLRYGTARFVNITGNTWVCDGVFVGTNSAAVSAYFTTGGSIALGGTLDRVRITTVNGTDTFDAGTVNILYEG